MLNCMMKIILLYIEHIEPLTKGRPKKDYFSHLSLKHQIQVKGNVKFINYFTFNF